MLQVLVGFLPWVLYWVLSSRGNWTAALLVALASAAGIVARRWFTQRAFETLEVVPLAFFAADALVTLVLGLAFFETYDVFMVNAVLALMAWGSLLRGSPFTYEYAREIGLI